jgi:uncharacterized RDD family membrane protein YckC
MTEPPEHIQGQPSPPSPPPVPPPPVPPPPPPVQAQFPAAPPVPASAYGQPDTSVLPGTYFDQASGLQLPDGTELASIGRRIGAYFLAIPLAIVTLGIGYVIWGAIIWARGQTPALQVLGMRCWRTDDNRAAGWWWMALREIIGRLVEGILSIITLAVSFILMCTRPDRRSIHDLIAGTVVLYDPNKVLSTTGQNPS